MTTNEQIKRGRTFLLRRSGRKSEFRPIREAITGPRHGELVGDGLTLAEAVSLAGHWAEAAVWPSWAYAVYGQCGDHSAPYRWSEFDKFAELIGEPLAKLVSQLAHFTEVEALQARLAYLKEADRQERKGSATQRDRELQCNMASAKAAKRSK